MAMDDRTHPSSAGAPRPGAAEAAATRQQFSAMLRGSLIPTVAVGVVVIVLSAVLGQARDTTSAALGAGVVVLFFSLSLLVMRQTAHLQPVAVMAVVLATYTVKILALGVVMIVLRDASWLSGQVLAIAIIVCTVVWLAFEMRAFTRLRILVAPGAAAGPHESSSHDEEAS
jgi:ATP synthase protein I